MYGTGETPGERPAHRTRAATDEPRPRVRSPTAWGCSTVRQHLRAGLLDEIGLAVVPVLLGSGERLFTDDLPLTGWRCTAYEPSPRVAHVRLRRDAAG